MKAKVLVPIILLFISFNASAKGIMFAGGIVGPRVYCYRDSIHTDMTMWAHTNFGSCQSFNYKWYKNGVLISTDSLTYTITSVGTYQGSFDAFDVSLGGAHFETDFITISCYLPINISITENIFECSFANQYQWYFNNQLIDDATAQKYVATENGTYKVMTPETGCYSAEIYYIKSIMSIRGCPPLPPTITNITLFPNPSTGTFTATLPTGTTQLEIVNMLGEMIENKIIETETSIDFNLFNDGIYFISAVTENGIMRKKIVVSK